MYFKHLSIYTMSVLHCITAVVLDIYSMLLKHNDRFMEIIDRFGCMSICSIRLLKKRIN